MGRPGLDVIVVRQRICAPLVYTKDSALQRFRRAIIPELSLMRPTVSAAGGQQTINQGFLQVAPSRGVSHTGGISLPAERKHTMANAMADPIARRPGITRRSLGGVALKFVSRLIRPTIITGMMAALIATADTPTVVPLTCGITWTRTGGVWIFLPDCSHQVPPSQLPPNGPPSGPDTPPGAPSTP